MPSRRAPGRFTVSSDGGEQVNVEIAFATPDRQAVVRVTLPKGTSVAEALRASAFAERFPDFDFDAASVGIWGQVVSRDSLVRDGDRIEVYRPLQRDPREARRERASGLSKKK